MARQAAMDWVRYTESPCCEVGMREQSYLGKNIDKKGGERMTLT